MQSQASPENKTLTPADLRQSAYALATKSGFKTSEFTLIVALIVAGLLLAIGHALNGEIAFACSSAAAVIFANIRANYKSAAVAKLIQAMQVAPITMQTATLRGVEAAVGQEAKAVLPVALNEAEKKLTPPQAQTT